VLYFGSVLKMTPINEPDRHNESSGSVSSLWGKSWHLEAYKWVQMCMAYGGPRYNAILEGMDTGKPTY
jgi:hypothetical protein